MSGGPGGDDTSGVSPLLALAGALLFYLAVRLLPVRAVFRDGDVVLLGNDPYAYLHIVTDIVNGAVPLTAPSGFGIGEPLLVVVLAAGSWLLGGNGTTGIVLAVYPVGAGLVVALGTYVMAVLLTDDSRVGLAAVVILAVTPLAVSRTALGFADHHAFDLLWITVIATCLTWLVVRGDAPASRRWAVGGLLGIAVAAQTITWNASPLLLVPVGIALVVWSLFAVRHPGSWRETGPLLAGLGIGAAATLVVHVGLGWQSTVVALSPGVVFVGGVVVVAGLLVTDWSERSVPSLLGLELVAGLAGVALLWLLAPGLLGDITAQLTAVSEYFGFHETTTIGETNPITAEFGPVLGFVVLLGFAPFLGLPAVPWAVWRAWNRNRPAWVLVAVFLLWFLGLAFVQRRFAVHLTPFLAVYAGIGFLALADWLELLRGPVPWKREAGTPGPGRLQPPERERLAILGAMAAVGTGTGLLLSGEILSRLEIDESAYRAATWIREYAGDRELSYPENYVLASWGRVRMYNHFVNGRSRSYGYARRTYGEFLQSTDPDTWYDQFEGRVGFVVTRDIGDVSPVLTQGKLHDEYGSGREYVDGVGHFRARWERAGGDLKVFEVVPGATVTGSGPPDTQFAMSTTVTLEPDGTRIRYQRLVRTGQNGEFSVTLAHPGRYEVGDSTIEVPESAVLDGNAIPVELDIGP